MLEIEIDGKKAEVPDGSTVMDADRIIVMEKGKIAGTGSHRELMNTCEVYREIVYSQLSGEEIA